LDDRCFLQEVFSQENYDTILHIAGISKSLLLVKEAIKAHVKWLILVYTTGIYSKYKAAGEMYRNIESKIYEIIAGKDIALTILRPTMIYGTLEDGNISVFMKMVDRFRIFPVVNGCKYELQPVYCGDLGGLMHSKTTENKNYVLSGGGPILLIDMLKEMANQLGVKNTFISIPF